MISFIPFIVLIVLITCCVAVFGNATLDGASQVSLLAASAVSVLIGHFSKRLEWENLEKEITDKIASCTPAIIILLLIGAIGGTWMVSGIVPTMIYYGMQIIRPEVFLVSSSVLCALVSLMIGSSWTTVATIGVALMGIGKAHGFDDGWIAGSIITGAYFGDKLSPLSDTTVLVRYAALHPYPLYALYHGAFVLGIAFYLPDCRTDDERIGSWQCAGVYGRLAAYVCDFALVVDSTCTDGCDDCAPLAIDGGTVPGYSVGSRGRLVGTARPDPTDFGSRWFPVILQRYDAGMLRQYEY